ncbi:hypothetical protein CDV36_014164 [Fusarium kuroshium]|uniref:Uncharacterized protein n=1 Tax=Fusarium kuroshium TaxID=2010991 RepID=A0A3M2RJU1_9HYPO|nr:hypothetical protein CDV36_014164 [Fusarium kuroshium]
MRRRLTGPCRLVKRSYELKAIKPEMSPTFLTLAFAAPAAEEASLSEFEGVVDTTDPVIQAAWNAGVSYTEGSTAVEARDESTLQARACKDPKGFSLCIAVCNTGCAVGCRCGSCFAICPQQCNQGKWKGCW